MHDIGFDAEKWVRHGPFAHVLGKAVPAKWHLTKERQRTSVSTRCKRTVRTILGYDTRRTDPLVNERCVRCMDDLQRLERAAQARRPTAAEARRSARRRRKQVSFADEIKQAEKDGVVGGGIFKPQEGKNVLRIVAGPLRQPEEYEGKTRVKWLVLVIDRADGIVKPWFMPHSIAKMIRDLQQSDDYAFEKTPMPYDITLNTKGAGTRDVEYGVVAARKNSDITPEEMVLIATFGDLSEYQRKIGERERKAPVKPFDPDEIPI